VEQVAMGETAEVQVNPHLLLDLVVVVVEAGI
jgi:hypothetical protein